jgi:hypothetical protein
MLELAWCLVTNPHIMSVCKQPDNIGIAHLPALLVPLPA